MKNLKIGKFEKTSFVIIVTFGIAMIMSFVGDSCHTFFGDWQCSIKNCHYAGQFQGHDDLVNYYHWGWRHWLFMSCGFCLFLVNFVRILDIAENG